MAVIERVKPTIFEGLEFYVSSDGTQCGASISALALMCGVSQQRLSKLLTDTTKGDAKWQKSATDRIFYSQLTNGSGTAKIVRSDTMVDIIETFAFRVTHKSEVALQTYRKFAKMGIDSWIKKVSGFQEPSSESDLLSVVNQVLTEVQEMKGKVMEYDDIRQVTVGYYAGLDGMLDSLPKVKTIVPSKDLWTVKDWLATKGISLAHNEAVGFGRMVHESYKTLTGKEAQYKWERRDGRSIKAGRGYAAEHFPILETAWKDYTA